MAEVTEISEEPGPFPDRIQQHEYHHGTAHYPEAMTDVPGWSQLAVFRMVRPLIEISQVKIGSANQKINNECDGDAVYEKEKEIKG